MDPLKEGMPIKLCSVFALLHYNESVGQVLAANTFTITLQ